MHSVMHRALSLAPLWKILKKILTDRNTQKHVIYSQQERSVETSRLRQLSLEHNVRIQNDWLAWPAKSRVARDLTWLRLVYPLYLSRNTPRRRPLRTCTGLGQYASLTTDVVIVVCWGGAGQWTAVNRAASTLPPSRLRSRFALPTRRCRT